MHVYGSHNTYTPQMEDADHGEPRVVVSLTLTSLCGVPPEALIHAIIDTANEVLEEIFDDYGPERMDRSLHEAVASFAEGFLPGTDNDKDK